MWGLFIKSNDGNIAMMFAFIITMGAIFLGVAVDGTRLISAKSRAQSIADAAALSGAAASEADAKDRLEIVQAYIDANLINLAPAIMNGQPTIVFDDTSETITVSLPAVLPMTFGAFMGHDSKPIGTKSTASYLSNNMDPVSIAFALDVSGSMKEPTSENRPKIAVLQSAIKGLYDAIESGTDHPEKLQDAIRSGMSAYNTDLVTTQPMAWGWSHIESSVDVLSAAGGTNSTPALQNSYTQLLNDRSWRAANDPRFEAERLQEYIIFMTDGNNNQPEFDQASVQICLDIKADGIELYSVAFDAPNNGVLLLVECATPNDELEEGSVGGDPSKCLNNGANGNGLALGHCADPETRSEHFFDANDAVGFEAAFARIGASIVRSNVRLN